MLEVLNEDYIRTAAAKGLSRRVVIFKHALRNALLPVITLIGLFMPALLTGAYFVETIYTIPGMGYLALTASSNATTRSSWGRRCCRLCSSSWATCSPTSPTPSSIRGSAMVDGVARGGDGAAGRRRRRGPRPPRLYGTGCVATLRPQPVGALRTGHRRDLGVERDLRAAARATTTPTQLDMKLIGTPTPPSLAHFSAPTSTAAITSRGRCSGRGSRWRSASSRCSSPSASGRYMG